MESKIGPNGRIHIIETEFYRIEGSKIRIAKLNFDPYNFSYISHGWEDEPIYNFPPHIMEQFGESLILAAEKEYERLEKVFRKEHQKILGIEEKKSRKITKLKD